MIPVKFILMLTQLQVWRQQWNKIERFNAFSNDHSYMKRVCLTQNETFVWTDNPFKTFGRDC